MANYNYQPLDRGMTRGQFNALRLGFRITNNAILTKIVEGKHPAVAGSDREAWRKACDSAMAAIAVAFPKELRDTFPPFALAPMSLIAAKKKHGVIGFAIRHNMSIDRNHLMKIRDSEFKKSNDESSK